MRVLPERPNGMKSTLCRCMTYYRVQTAIKRAAATMADARGRQVVR